MENDRIKQKDKIKTLPKGLAILTILGPGLVWTSDLVGSGEVIITTRNGAVLGIAVLWAIVIGIFLKCWIGLSGARYTVCTGEGMIDMFSRIPGPRNWIVWVVMVIQLLSAAIGMGSLASASGNFLHGLVPLQPKIAGWLISILALIVLWSGKFNILKFIMTFLVAVMCIGTIYVAVVVSPSLSELFKGLLFKIPEVPEWAINKAGVSQNPWREILPLIGWAAGGFGSQVWYTYWVLGEGYGMANRKQYGQPADLEELKNLNNEDARKLKGWCRIVNIDASLAMIITAVLSVCFLIAGAMILRPLELAPKDSELAFTLSKIFSSRWGQAGGYLFILSGTAALSGTLMVQMAGWPRLIADTVRICIPKFGRIFRWAIQFRIFLVFFFLTNMLIVFTFGIRPVFLVKTAAVLDGLILTPVQAICVFIGLFFIMPKLFNRNVYNIIRPHWIYALFLILAVIVFSYFCIFQVPFII
jgi:Mn2+/Fe2+ NRAMP family transporter